ncbi:hypothetical protein [Erythrobacter donghaensis]|uniref:hypothetical protein n=1 Tax=Erythrobacter donghaensis TaxID=267135 RepID=UPI000A3D01C7|nr:hypothetical protein [Erythrobacter donghaensis]
MTALLAALLAGTVSMMGPSPLADLGHAPQWQSLPVDDQGEGWIDPTWHQQAEVDGRPVELVLVRMNLTDSDGKPMLFDAIMAVDCPAQTIGMKESWLFLSRYGDNRRAPITTIDMTFASTPPSIGDLALLAHACTGERK